MAILLNDNLKIALAKPVDSRYGPYVDTQTALNSIPSFQRYPGLVVGIRDSGDVTEYWFKDGVIELVPKISATSAGDWQVISTSSSVADNSYVIADSSSAGFTLTLSASPVSGSYVWIQDAKGSWEANNVIVDPNGNQIVGLSDSLSLNVSNSIVLLTYVGGDVGWDVKNVAGDFSDYLTGIIGATGATGVGILPLTTAALGSFGGSSQIPSLTIDEYGRVVSASNNSITPQGIGALGTADIIGITKGGTGSTAAAAALTALGAQAALTSAAPLSIAQGGTGASTEEASKMALAGVIPISIRHNNALTLATVGTLNGATWTINSNIVQYTSFTQAASAGNAPLAIYQAVSQVGIANMVIIAIDTENKTITLNNNATVSGTGTVTVQNSTLNEITFTAGTSPNTLDGRALSIGESVLLTAQACAVHQGPWLVKTLGASGVCGVFERPSWFAGGQLLKTAMIFGAQYGSSNAGFTITIAPNVGSNNCVIGTGNLSANTLSNKSTIVSVNNTTAFSARQTFVANSSTVNPYSFQASTTQLSTLLAHAVEWDSNLMYITPGALSTANLRRTINAGYIPALTSADILTLGAAQSTIQANALTSTMQGVLGQTILDAVNDALYVCTGTGAAGAAKWRKVSLSTF
jgi:hypothetical protein